MLSCHLSAAYFPCTSGSGSYAVIDAVVRQTNTKAWGGAIKLVNYTSPARYEGGTVPSSKVARHGGVKLALLSAVRAAPATWAMA